MKFCLIIGLAVCAFFVQSNAYVHELEPIHHRLALVETNTAEIENIFLDVNQFSLEKLRELLEGLVNLVLPITEEILEQADVLFKQAVAKAKEILENSEPVLQKVIDDIIRVLEVVVAEHGASIECVKQQRPAIEALARSSAAKLKVCGENAVAEGKKAHGEIQAEIEAVKASLTALKNLLSECRNNDPAQVAKCVVGKAKEIRQGIAQLLDSVKKIVEASAPKLVSIVQQTEECAKPIVQNARTEGRQIVDKVKACIASNQAITMVSDNSGLEKLRELLQHLVNVALPVLEELLEQADVILRQALEKAKEIVANAEPILQKVIDEVIRSLEQLAQENVVAVKCVKEQRPAVEALGRESAAKLKVCAQKAVEDGEKAKEQIQAEIDAVKGSLTALKNLLSECKHQDPAVVAKCVVQKSKEVREKILELVDNAKQVVEAAVPKVAVIVQQTSECVKPVVTNAKVQGAKIVQAVKTCIANGY